MARWLTPDWSARPEGVPYATLANPQTLNLYAYVGNNPVTHTDPDGHAGNDPQSREWDLWREFDMPHTPDVISTVSISGATTPALQEITIKINVIYDADANGYKGMKPEEKEQFQKTILQEAKDKFGGIGIKFKVSFTEGQIVREESGKILDVAGFDKGALNVFVTKVLPPDMRGAWGTRGGATLVFKSGQVLIGDWRERGRQRCAKSRDGARIPAGWQAVKHWTKHLGRLGKRLQTFED